MFVSAPLNFYFHAGGVSILPDALDFIGVNHLSPFTLLVTFSLKTCPFFLIYLSYFSVDIMHLSKAWGTISHPY